MTRERGALAHARTSGIIIAGGSKSDDLGRGVIEAVSNPVPRKSRVAGVIC